MGMSQDNIYCFMVGDKNIYTAIDGKIRPIVVMNIGKNGINCGTQSYRLFNECYETEEEANSENAELLFNNWFKCSSMNSVTNEDAMKKWLKENKKQVLAFLGINSE